MKRWRELYEVGFFLFVFVLVLMCVELGWQAQTNKLALLDIQTEAGMCHVNGGTWECLCVPSRHPRFDLPKETP